MILRERWLAYRFMNWVVEKIFSTESFIGTIKTYFKILIYRVSIVTALLEYSDNPPIDREANNDVAQNLGKAGSHAKEIKEIEKWESQERKRVSISCSCCFNILVSNKKFVKNSI